MTALRDPARHTVEAALGATPDPRLPGPNRRHAVRALLRAGVLVGGGLALLAMVAWPEDHVERTGGGIWSSDLPYGWDRPAWYEEVTSRRWPSPVIRDDSYSVLARRIESVLGLGPK